MLRKIISFLISFCFLFEQIGFAQIAGQMDISGRMSSLIGSVAFENYRPLHLRYLSYDQLNNDLKILLDKGSVKETKPAALENATNELLKYFFIGISLPDDVFWVNLRPDSPKQIIDEDLAKTDMGKIMLEADLQLKKDTASFTSPETFEGREYWDKLYKRAEELFASQNVTIPTLTRPWIVPDEIIVRETPGSAYIYKATLKVMLEQDYLKGNANYRFPDERFKQLNEYSSQILRETIIPKLTREVNSSKRYAPLRQVYYSLILAQWFKDKYKSDNGKYSRKINSKDLTNLRSNLSWNKDAYFKAYQKSFKDGEYNIKENRPNAYGQTIRSYFSGGMTLQLLEKIKAGMIQSKTALGSVLRQKYSSFTFSAEGVVDIEQQSAAEAPSQPLSVSQKGGNKPANFDLILSDLKDLLKSKGVRFSEAKISELAQRIAEAQAEAGGAKVVKVNLAGIAIPGLSDAEIDSFSMVLGTLGLGAKSTATGKIQQKADGNQNENFDWSTATLEEMSPEENRQYNEKSRSMYFGKNNFSAGNFFSNGNLVFNLKFRDSLSREQIISVCWDVETSKEPDVTSSTSAIKDPEILRVFRSDRNGMGMKISKEFAVAFAKAKQYIPWETSGSAFRIIQAGNFQGNGTFGLDVGDGVARQVLKIIQSNDPQKLKEMRQDLVASFAHEMVHDKMNEMTTAAGNEIISQLTQLVIDPQYVRSEDGDLFDKLEIFRKTNDASRLKKSTYSPDLYCALVIIAERWKGEIKEIKDLLDRDQNENKIEAIKNIIALLNELTETRRQALVKNILNEFAAFSTREVIKEAADAEEALGVRQPIIRQLYGNIAQKDGGGIQPANFDLIVSDLKDFLKNRGVSVSAENIRELAQRIALAQAEANGTKPAKVNLAGMVIPGLTEGLSDAETDTLGLMLGVLGMGAKTGFKVNRWEEAAYVVSRIGPELWDLITFSVAVPVFVLSYLGKVSGMRFLERSIGILKPFLTRTAPIKDGVSVLGIVETFARFNESAFNLLVDLFHYSLEKADAEKAGQVKGYNWEFTEKEIIATLTVNLRTISRDRNAPLKDKYTAILQQVLPRLIMYEANGGYKQHNLSGYIYFEEGCKILAQEVIAPFLGKALESYKKAQGNRNEIKAKIRFSLRAIMDLYSGVQEGFVAYGAWYQDKIEEGIRAAKRDINTLLGREADSWDPQRDLIISLPRFSSTLVFTHLLNFDPLDIEAKAGRAIAELLENGGLSDEEKQQVLAFLQKEDIRLSGLLRNADEDGLDIAYSILFYCFKKRDLSFLDILSEIRSAQLLLDEDSKKTINSLLGSLTDKEISDSEYKNTRDALKNIVDTLILVKRAELGSQAQNDFLKRVQDLLWSGQPAEGQGRREKAPTNSQVKELERLYQEVCKDTIKLIIPGIDAQELAQKSKWLFDSSETFTLFAQAWGLYLRVKQSFLQRDQEVEQAMKRLLLESGSLQEFNSWLYAQAAWNRDIYQKLINAKYSPLLWEKGFRTELLPVFRKLSPAKLTAQTHQLMEFLDNRGIPHVEKELLTYADAKAFADKYIKTKAFADKFAVGAREELENILRDVERILEETYELEQGYKEKNNGKPERVRVEITMDFLRDANSGKGVPGCYNPSTGEQRHMPLVHALETGATFLTVYNEAGKAIANAVLAFTEKGVVVFPIYNSSSLALGQVVFQALKEMYDQKLIPGVFIFSQKKNPVGALEGFAIEGFGIENFLDEFKEQVSKDNFIQNEYHDFGVLSPERMATTFSPQYRFGEKLSGYKPLAGAQNEEQNQAQKKEDSQRNGIRGQFVKAIFALGMRDVNFSGIINNFQKLIFETQDESELENLIDQIKLKNGGDLSSREKRDLQEKIPAIIKTFRDKYQKDGGNTGIEEWIQKRDKVIARMIADLFNREKIDNRISEQKIKNFEKIYRNLPGLAQRIAEEYRKLAKGQDIGKIEIYIVGGRPRGEPLKESSDIDIIVAVENDAQKLGLSEGEYWKATGAIIFNIIEEFKAQGIDLPIRLGQMYSRRLAGEDGQEGFEFAGLLNEYYDNLRKGSSQPENLLKISDYVWFDFQGFGIKLEPQNKKDIEGEPGKPGLGIKLAEDVTVSEGISLLGGGMPQEQIGKLIAEALKTRSEEAISRLRKARESNPGLFRDQVDNLARKSGNSKYAQEVEALLAGKAQRLAEIINGFVLGKTQGAPEENSRLIATQRSEAKKFSDRLEEVKRMENAVAREEEMLYLLKTATAEQAAMIFIEFLNQGNFSRMVEVYESFADPKFRDNTIIYEYYLVALNKVGRTKDVIAAIKAMPAEKWQQIQNGEIYGALGRAYKDMYSAADSLLSELEKPESRRDQQALESKIEEYKKRFSLDPATTVEEIAGNRAAVAESRKKSLQDCHRAYLDGFLLDFDYYPGVNAVYTLFWLANLEEIEGNQAQAKKMYEQAKRLADMTFFASNKDKGKESKDYWFLVTMLELSILRATGDVAESLDKVLALINNREDLWMIKSTLESLQKTRTIRVLDQAVIKIVIDKLQERHRQIESGEQIFKQPSAPQDEQSKLLERFYSLSGLNSNFVSGALYVEGATGFGGALRAAAITKWDIEVARELLKQLGLEGERDFEKFDRTVNDALARRFRTAELQDLHGPFHAVYDNIQMALNTLFDVYYSRDSKTNIMLSYLMRIGDCRHQATVKQLLFELWKTSLINADMEEAHAALKQGDAGLYAEYLDRVRGLARTQLYIMDVEVRAPVDMSRGLYNPVVENNEFVARDKLDDQDSPIEEHTLNVLGYYDESGKLVRLELRDSFYRDFTENGKRLNPYNFGSYDAKGRIKHLVVEGEKLAELLKNGWEAGEIDVAVKDQEGNVVRHEKRTIRLTPTVYARFDRRGKDNSRATEVLIAGMAAGKPEDISGLLTADSYESIREQLSAYGAKLDAFDKMRFWNSNNKFVDAQSIFRAITASLAAIVAAKAKGEVSLSGLAASSVEGIEGILQQIRKMPWLAEQFHQGYYQPLRAQVDSTVPTHKTSSIIDPRIFIRSFNQRTANGIDVDRLVDLLDLDQAEARRLIERGNFPDAKIKLGARHIKSGQIEAFYRLAKGLAEAEPLPLEIADFIRKQEALIAETDRLSAAGASKEEVDKARAKEAVIVNTLQMPWADLILDAEEAYANPQARKEVLVALQEKAIILAVALLKDKTFFADTLTVSEKLDKLLNYFHAGWSRDNSWDPLAKMSLEQLRLTGNITKDWTTIKEMILQLGLSGEFQDILLEGARRYEGAGEAAEQKDGGKPVNFDLILSDLKDLLKNKGISVSEEEINELAGRIAKAQAEAGGAKIVKVNLAGMVIPGLAAAETDAFSLALGTLGLGAKSADTGKIQQKSGGDTASTEGPVITGSLREVAGQIRQAPGGSPVFVDFDDTVVSRENDDRGFMYPQARFFDMRNKMSADPLSEETVIEEAIYLEKLGISAGVDKEVEGIRDIINAAKEIDSLPIIITNRPESLREATIAVMESLGIKKGRDYKDIIFAGPNPNRKSEIISDYVKELGQPESEVFFIDNLNGNAQRVWDALVKIIPRSKLRIFDLEGTEQQEHSLPEFESRLTQLAAESSEQSRAEWELAAHGALLQAAQMLLADPGDPATTEDVNAFIKNNGLDNYGKGFIHRFISDIQALQSAKSFDGGKLNAKLFKEKIAEFEKLWINVADKLETLSSIPGCELLGRLPAYLGIKKDPAGKEVSQVLIKIKELVEEAEKQGKTSELTDLDLNSFIGKIKQDMDKPASDGDVRIQDVEFQIDGQTAQPQQLTIRTYPMVLELIVREYVLNAVKKSYSAEEIASGRNKQDLKQIRIVVNLLSKENKAQIKVIDQGVGMDEDTQKNIFTAAPKPQEKLRSIFQSSNLGLYFVWNFSANILEGEVSAFSSGPGQGSEFGLKLPLSITKPLADEYVEPIAQAVRHDIRNNLIAGYAVLTSIQESDLQAYKQLNPSSAEAIDALLKMRDIWVEMNDMTMPGQQKDGGEVIAALGELTGEELEKLSDETKGIKDIKRRALINFVKEQSIVSVEFDPAPGKEKIVITERENRTGRILNTKDYNNPDFPEKIYPFDSVTAVTPESISMHDVQVYDQPEFSSKWLVREDKQTLMRVSLDDLLAKKWGVRLNYTKGLSFEFGIILVQNQATGAFEIQVQEQQNFVPAYEGSDWSAGIASLQPKSSRAGYRIIATGHFHPEGTEEMSLTDINTLIGQALQSGNDATEIIITAGRLKGQDKKFVFLTAYTINYRNIASLQQKARQCPTESVPEEMFDSQYFTINRSVFLDGQWQPIQDREQFAYEYNASRQPKSAQKDGGKIGKARFDNLHYPFLMVEDTQNKEMARVIAFDPEYIFNADRKYERVIFIDSSIAGLQFDALGKDKSLMENLVKLGVAARSGAQPDTEAIIGLSAPYVLKNNIVIVKALAMTADNDIPQAKYQVVIADNNGDLRFLAISEKLERNLNYALALKSGYSDRDTNKARSFEDFPGEFDVKNDKTFTRVFFDNAEEFMGEIIKNDQPTLAYFKESSADGGRKKLPTPQDIANNLNQILNNAADVERVLGRRSPMSKDSTGSPELSDEDVRKIMSDPDLVEILKEFQPDELRKLQERMAGIAPVSGNADGGKKADKIQLPEENKSEKPPISRFSAKDTENILKSRDLQEPGWLSDLLGKIARDYNNGRPLKNSADPGAGKDEYVYSAKVDPARKIMAASGSEPGSFEPAEAVFFSFAVARKSSIDSALKADVIQASQEGKDILFSFKCTVQHLQSAPHVRIIWDKMAMPQDLQNQGFGGKAFSNFVEILKNHFAGAAIRSEFIDEGASAIFRKNFESAYFLRQRAFANQPLSLRNSEVLEAIVPDSPNKPGGIDFRGLPIINQPGALPLPAGTNQLPMVNIADLDQEWQQIETMAASEIVPSTQRLKEFLGACCNKGALDKYSGGVLACIADILRLEEAKAKATEPALRDILILLESNRPESELERSLSFITVAAGEPQA